jgi:hypothetical protein
MKDLSDRVASLFYHKARAMDRASRFVRGVLILFGAACAGASQLLPTPSTDAVGISAIPFNQIAGWLGASLALAGGVWSLYVDETVPGALEEARNAIEYAREEETKFAKQEALRKQEIEDLRYSLQWLSLLYACLPSFREVVENLLRQNKKATDEDLQTLLSLQARSVITLLEFENIEYWTLAIYRHEGPQTETGHLICCAHMRSQRSEEQRAHRTWPVGEGIAGHTYSIGRELVVEDLQNTTQGSWVKVSPSSIQIVCRSSYPSRKLFQSVGSRCC